MEQLSFAHGNKAPHQLDEPMFMAAETKFIKGRFVQVPLGCIKKRLQKTMQKTSQHFFRLDQAKKEKKTL